MFKWADININILVHDMINLLYQKCNFILNKFIGIPILINLKVNSLTIFFGEYKLVSFDILIDLHR